MLESNYNEVIKKTAEEWAILLESNLDLLNQSIEIEGLIQSFFREVSRQTTEILYNKAAQQAKQSVKEPSLWVKRNNQVTFYTLFGPVKVASPYLYNETNGQSKTPTRELLGIEGKARSSALEKALVDFGVEHPFGVAAQRFQEHYGWAVSQSVLRSVTLRHGRQSLAFIEKKLESNKELFQQTLAERPGKSELLVELDGCELRTCQLKKKRGRGKSPKRKLPKKKRVIAWKEVRLGLCRGLDEQRKKYIAHRGSYEELGNQIFCLSVEKGLSSQTEVIAVCDGGIGLKESLESQFDKFQFILDKPHLESHMYETAESMGFLGDEREKWVKGKMNLAFKGKSEKLLDELKEEQKERCNDRLRQLIGYVTRFKDSIHYGYYRKKGWPIGSGEVESGHKYVIQQRLKITGASWLEENLNPMLGLRILRQNEWWTEFWSCRSQNQVSFNRNNI